MEAPEELGFPCAVVGEDCCFGGDDWAVPGDGRFVALKALRTLCDSLLGFPPLGFRWFQASEICWLYVGAILVLADV